MPSALSSIATLLRSLQNLLFPRFCPGCGIRLPMGGALICPQCLLSFRPSIPADHTDTLRTQLRPDAPFERIGAFVRYANDTPAGHVVRSLKFSRQWQLGHLMGQLAATQMPKGFFDGIDVLIPIPISRQRRAERGFNQSELIAQGISLVTGIPVRTDLLRRVRNTRPQTTLHISKRHDNLHDAFQTIHSNGMTAKHIMLVDDVITTGSTMHEAGRALHEAGFAHLYAFSWAFAYTPPSGPLEL